VKTGDPAGCGQLTQGVVEGTIRQVRRFTRELVADLERISIYRRYAIVDAAVLREAAVEIDSAVRPRAHSWAQRLLLQNNRPKPSPPDVPIS
jgi:hypothetical protein